jgi:hypothetical protein
VQDTSADPLQELPAAAIPGPVRAVAVVAHQPVPAPPESVQFALDTACAPGAESLAALWVSMRRVQLGPVQLAAASAPWVAVACPLVSQRRPSVAVQDAVNAAWLPPAVACPREVAVQPAMPTHPALTCGRPLVVCTAASVSQPPAPVQLAVPVLCGAVEVLWVLVGAHPVVPVPLWQAALA